MKVRSAKCKGKVCSSTIAGSCSRVAGDDGLEGKESDASISRAKRWICDALVRLAGAEAYIYRAAHAVAGRA